MGDHADRCVHVLLRMYTLQNAAEAQSGRLLRVLFLWLRSLPTYSGACGVLPGTLILRCTLGVDFRISFR